MKLLTRNIAIAAVLGLATACGAQQAQETTSEAPLMTSHVNAAEAQTLLTNNSKIVVLDIRTQKEFESGHIDGARLIDFKSADFAENVSKLDKTAPYIVHCHSGGRSTKSLDVFKAQGFTNVSHLDGGIKGWKDAGLPLSQN